MFSRQDLVFELPRLSAIASPPMECVEFGHEDFNSPGSEQSIWAFRGSKKEFNSGLFFWIKTLQAQGWGLKESSFHTYTESGLCKPLSEIEFCRFVAEYSRSLCKQLPRFLLDASGYRNGLQMYAEWNDVGAVAELEEAFVAFYWSTTA